MQSVRGLKPSLLFSLKGTYIECTVLPAMKHCRSSTQNPSTSATDEIVFNETMTTEWASDAGGVPATSTKHGAGVSAVS